MRINRSGSDLSRSGSDAVHFVSCPFRWFFSGRFPAVILPSRFALAVRDFTPAAIAFAQSENENQEGRIRKHEGRLRQRFEFDLYAARPDLLDVRTEKGSSGSESRLDRDEPVVDLEAEIHEIASGSFVCEKINPQGGMLAFEPGNCGVLARRVPCC